MIDKLPKHVNINNELKFSISKSPIYITKCFVPKREDAHRCPNTAQDSKASSPSPPTQCQAHLLTCQTPEDLTMLSAHCRKIYLNRSRVTAYKTQP